METAVFCSHTPCRGQPSNMNENFPALNWKDAALSYQIPNPMYLCLFMFHLHPAFRRRGERAPRWRRRRREKWKARIKITLQVAASTRCKY